MNSNPGSPDILLVVEKDDDERFKIRSNQLEQIGLKLRGQRHFSVFNSIILPLIVSVVTIVFTTLIQYISWSNTVNLQDATDVANKATKSYEKVASAIGQRIYSTFLFVPSLRELIRAKGKLIARDEILASRSGTTGSGDADQPFSSEFLPGPNREILLNKFDLELKKNRFTAYYDQLRRWNEEYDHLLTEVDYALDRPILLQAGKTQESIRVFRHKISKINCDLSLTDQFTEIGLSPDSLKLRLAGINHCFIQVHSILDQKTGKALAGNDLSWDDELGNKFTQKLGSIKTMTNEFRCYALHRIDYYNHQKEHSILSPRFFLTNFMKDQKKNAFEHFKETAEQCNPENRPT